MRDAFLVYKKNRHSFSREVNRPLADKYPAQRPLILAMRFGCSAEHAALGGKTARGQPRQAPARGHCGRRAPKNRKEGGGATLSSPSRWPPPPAQQSDAQLGSSGSSKGRVNGSAPGARASRALSRPGEQSGSEQEEEEEAEGAQK
ncbi:unnamed protein product [Prorocentrum cordatum]|uniref:Uncharacterized protein n=2 Tax=Prorocentrum cordatum TaxID=2364126 RepID=A0ABN9XTU6_9DINO|nr:unnamed protein product [Polarella glacialis]